MPAPRHSAMGGPASNDATASGGLAGPAVRPPGGPGWPPPPAARTGWSSGRAEQVCSTESAIGRSTPSAANVQPRTSRTSWPVPARSGERGHRPAARRAATAAAGQACRIRGGTWPGCRCASGPLSIHKEPPGQRLAQVPVRVLTEAAGRTNRQPASPAATPGPRPRRSAGSHRTASVGGPEWRGQRRKSQRRGDEPARGAGAAALASGAAAPRGAPAGPRSARTTAGKAAPAFLRAHVDRRSGLQVAAGRAGPVTGRTRGERRRQRVREMGRREVIHSRPRSQSLSRNPPAGRDLSQPVVAGRAGTPGCGPPDQRGAVPAAQTAISAACRDPSSRRITVALPQAAQQRYRYAGRSRAGISRSRRLVARRTTPRSVSRGTTPSPRPRDPLLGGDTPSGRTPLASAGGTTPLAFPGGRGEPARCR